ncbi:MAG: Flp family type IVb pilin [Planctomycetaceae bacterium]|nr:Flp family type IVb pilin [Planctomycetaceae bacterium]
MLRRVIRKFIHDDSGPTAVEYAVMLALIIVLCISGISMVGGGNNGWWTRTNTSLQSYGF